MIKQADIISLFIIYITQLNLNIQIQKRLVVIKYRVRLF